MHYQYFGLYSFAILLCGLTFIVWRWPQGKHMTFSQHVAVARYKILYYILLFAFALPLLILFFLQWFVPTLQLSVWFSICLVTSAIAQQACTLIPETGGQKTRYHQLLAGTSAIFLLPPVVMLLFLPTLPTLSNILAGISLTIMLGIIVMAFRRQARSHLLLLQSIYYAAFFAPVLFISYLQ